jgi:rfaE bifunctional protein kinase chain/domain
MTNDRLNELTSRFARCRVAVVGDFFLDKYLDLDPSLEEKSIETGLAAHQVVRIRHSPGAAGNVAQNLASLGVGRLRAIGFTGKDGEGYDLRADLTAIGCDDRMLEWIPDRHTPTYLKPCDITVPGIGGEHERFDTKNRQQLPAECEARIIQSLRRALSEVDAVIVADQVEEDDCGVITDKVRDELAALAAQFPEVIFWVDSRRRIGRFRNVTLKPNAAEAIAAALPCYDGADDEIITEAGETLRARTGKPVFVTRSERGMLVFDDDGRTEVPGVHLDGPIDPTGAGDSCTAAAVLGLISGATNAEAALLANLVGSITVQQLGTTGRATVEQVAERLEVWRGQHA